MKLKKLISGLPIKLYRGNLECEITGLCTHSKRVAPGNLFIARKGSVSDGAQFIEEALQAGAVAILSSFADPFIKRAVQLTHPDPSMFEAELAARFYGEPSHELFCVGITGTSGKTTTAYLIKHLLDGLQISCGLIGTVEYLVGPQRFDAEMTTPDAITNQKLLKEMKRYGQRAAVMEVSSHALVQGRVEKIDFDAALFTNLSQDHLDYHQDMEDYASAKARLFSNLKPEGIAIINGDSVWSEKMVQGCRAQVMRYGLGGGSDLIADEIELLAEGSSFRVSYGEQQIKMRWKLIGRYNIYNCLAAIGLCLSRGAQLSDIAPLVQNFQLVPGRLEKVDNKKGLSIFVDYSHKPDALENVLSCLGEFKKGRLITVFGCGGDRDKLKRPLMGKVASIRSDFSIITSDNPRSEDPQKICEEVASGFTKANFEVIVDRRSAIAKAISLATHEDVVLIAGKGHETYQIFARQTLPFDDRKIAQEFANSL